MPDHLEIRSTPYGRFLVPVDPDHPEGVSPVVGTEVPALEQVPAASAPNEPGVLATLRLAIATLGRRSRSPLDEQQTRLRAETQAVMDRADAAIASLFEDYLQRLDAPDASPETSPSPDTTAPDAESRLGR